VRSSEEQTPYLKGGGKKKKDVNRLKSISGGTSWKILAADQGLSEAEAQGMGISVVRNLTSYYIQFLLREGGAI